MQQSQYYNDAVEKNYEFAVEREDGLVYAHGKSIECDPKIFYCLRSKGMFRHSIIWLIEWKWFERLVILIIVLNSLCLIVYDYNDRNNNTERNQILDQFSVAFNAFFIFECIMKILAKGLFFHKKSYFKDGYNIIDFFVVLTAIIEMCPLPSTTGLRAVRTLRALRPLRSINAIPSMKKLVNILLKSLPKLLNVIALLGFAMVLFGIFGLNFFSGNLYYQCRTTPKPINETFWPILEEHERLCGALDCPEGSYCGNPKQYNIPLQYENITNNKIMTYGVMNFDNLGNAILTIFEVLTIFGWSNIMQNYMETTNQYFSAFFFSFIVIFGSFFLLNLILAVIVDAYKLIDFKEKQKDLQKREIEAQKREKKFQAIKTMFRMMKVSKDKREIIESGGFKFRWSFFDVVFELVRVERYEKVVSPKRKSTIGGLINKHLSQKINIQLVDTNSIHEENSVSPQKSIQQEDNNIEELKIAQEIHFRFQKREDEELMVIQEEENQIEDEDSKSQDSRQQELSQNIDQKQYLDLNDSNIQLLKSKDTFAKQSLISNKQDISDSIGLNFSNTRDLNSLDLDQTQTLGFKQKNSFISNSKMQLQYDVKKRKSSDSKQFEVVLAKRRSISDNNIVQNSSIGILKQPNNQKSIRQKGNNKFQNNDSLNFQSEQFSSMKTVLSQKIKIKVTLTSKFKNLQKKLNEIVNSTWFKYSMNFVIVFNCIIMAQDRYPISDEELLLQLISNSIFYVIYVIEMILKLIGLGFKNYFRDGFNIFDAIIILLSTIDIIINSIFYQSKSSSLSILRGFRILRILKIAKSQKQMQNFQQTINNTLRDLRNFSILIFLVILVYTLISLEFFAYSIKFDENNKFNLDTGKSPRGNFDGFINAVSTVFVILLGENYFTYMYDSARSVGIVSVVFFVTLIMFGNIILLKLFLAVLLENFEDKRKELEEMKEKELQRNKSKKTKNAFIKRVKDYLISLWQRCKKIKKSDQYSEKEKSEVRSLDHSFASRSVVELKDNNKTLYIFSEENKIRQFCKYILALKYFELVILILITGSSIILALETPFDDPQSQKIQILQKIDITFLIIFSLEIFMKIISKGLIFNGSKSYLRSRWDIIDFIIVLMSILSLDWRLQSIIGIKLIKSLRPLRIINRFEGLRLASLTLIRSIPQIGNVLFVCLIFYMIFGIFTVTFLKGEYYNCYTEQLEEIKKKIDLSVIQTKWDCLCLGGEWINKELNFDNVFNAMVLLYSISTVNWNIQMYNAVDAVNINYQPIVGTNQWWILFFILFMILFAFFLLNLFVGVIVGQFNTEKERLGKNFMLTETQKEWLRLKMMLLNTKPVIKKIINTSSIIRKISFKITSHKNFEIFIFIIIVCNTIVLSLNWYNIENSTFEIIQIINAIFTCIFLFEALLKIISLQKAYFQDNWNKFDFIIALISVIGVILDQTTDIQVGGQASIIRSFRVVRLFKLMKRAKVLKLITDTFIVTLPHLMNVGGLLLIILYIYAIFGMQMFAMIRLNEGLNERWNFHNFLQAYLLLVRIGTGEEWSEIMVSAANHNSIIYQCDDDFNLEKYNKLGYPNACGSNYAILYFLTYNLFVMLVFLNLFIALVLQSFEDMNNKENKLLSDENMDKLRECWSNFDEEGISFISIQDFIPFLTLLGEPLGFTKQEAEEIKAQNDFIKHLELPTYNKMQHLYYYDVVTILTQYAYLKLETQRKIKQQLMNDVNNFDQMSINIIESIKKEMDFETGLYKAKEILAYKEAKYKEHKLYKNILAIKDDLDLQHLWAGGRIKDMYKNTNMNFNGGELQRKNSTFKSIIQNQKTIKAVIDNDEEQKLPEIMQIKIPSKSIKIEPLEEQIIEATSQHDNNHKGKKNNKRNQMWNMLSKASLGSRDFDSDQNETHNLQKNSSKNLTIMRRRSSILFPVIQPIKHDDSKKETSNEINIEEVEDNHESNLDHNYENNSKKHHLFKQPKQKAFNFLNKNMPLSLPENRIFIRDNDQIVFDDQGLPYLQDIDSITSKQQTLQNNFTQRHQVRREDQVTFQDFLTSPNENIKQQDYQVKGQNKENSQNSVSSVSDENSVENFQFLHENNSILMKQKSEKENQEPDKGINIMFYNQDQEEDQQPELNIKLNIDKENDIDSSIIDHQNNQIKEQSKQLIQTKKTIGSGKTGKETFRGVSDKEIQDIFQENEIPKQTNREKN